MSKGGAPFEQDRKVEAMLKNARVIERQQARTVHHETILFQGSTIGFFLVADTQNKVSGYQIIIEDPGENKRYVFQFGQEVMQDLNVWANGVPNIGEDIPSGESG